MSSRRAAIMVGIFLLAFALLIVLAGLGVLK